MTGGRREGKEDEDGEMIRNGEERTSAWGRHGFMFFLH